MDRQHIVGTETQTLRMFVQRIIDLNHYRSSGRIVNSYDLITIDCQSGTIGGYGKVSRSGGQFEALHNFSRIGIANDYNLISGFNEPLVLLDKCQSVGQMPGDSAWMAFLLPPVGSVPENQVGTFDGNSLAPVTAKSRGAEPTGFLAVNERFSRLIDRCGNYYSRPGNQKQANAE
jgi:hypothetical protein